MGTRAKILTLLWTLALLVSIFNALVVVWRLPVQKKLANDADEQAVQKAARWIAPLPVHARLLLLASNADQTHFHFSTRLIYFVYPHRIDIALNHLPPGALSGYDGILAFGRMAPLLEARQKTAANGWRVAGRDTRVSFIVSSRLASAVPLSPPDSRLPLSLRLLSGLFSLIVVVVLGALLSGLTLRAPPFNMWWANLAAAHLIGATAFTVVQQVCIVLAGKPLVWPVYALLVATRLIKSRLVRPSANRPADELPIQPTKFSQESVSNVSSNGPPSVKHADKAPEIASSAGRLAEGLTNRLFISRVSRQFPRRFLSNNLLCRAVLLLGIFTVLERMWLIGLDWDALAIWQLKAKMLFWDGNLAAWQDTTPFPYAHFDYPLLTPLLTWWTYRHGNAIDLHWAQMNGLLFYADLLAIFTAAACRYAPMWAALLATALLSALPEVTLHAVSGYADLPLCVYFLGAGVFLARALVEQDAAAWPLVGWMLAGVMLVKNEGLLACVSAFAVIGLYLLRARRAPTAAPDNAPTKHASLWWLLAPGIAYLPWWLLKHRWNLSNDVMQPLHPPHFTIRLLWWRMWYAIIYGFSKQMLWLGPWFPAWGLFGVVVLASGAVAVKRSVPFALPLWLLAGIQICGYLAIYMITPAALPAHIISSVDRLILHVAPTLLLAALLSCFAEEKNALQTPAQTE